MIYLMLNNLCFKILECLFFLFELLVQIFYYYNIITLCWTLSRQWQTSLLCIIARLGMVYNLWIHHNQIFLAYQCCQNGFPYANHVGSHPYAAFCISTDRIQQISSCLSILFGCWFWFLMITFIISDFFCISKKNAKLYISSSILYSSYNKNFSCSKKVP